MTGALCDALREEEALLRRRLDVVTEALALVLPAYAAPEPPQPPAADPPPAAAARVRRPARARRARRTMTREQVRAHVVAHGPAKLGEIVAALGGHPNSMNRTLRSLLDSGEIEADGPSGARRYRAPRRRRGASAPERGVYPVYDEICDRGGATTDQIVEATGLPVAMVVEQGLRLKQLNLVRFTGNGDRRRWLPAGRAPGRGAAR